MTRIKICGIRQLDDARAAVAAGADAIGFVFWPASPRFIEPEAASAIMRALPPFVTGVGLVVDLMPDAVEAVVASSRVDMIQYHGQEPLENCARCPRPWIRALRMRPGLAVQAEAEHWLQAGARGILLDAWDPVLPGGTGHAFDWDRVPPDLRSHLVLAGGLTPLNVAEAIHRVNPAAVDVSGGVESARGIKSQALIRAFCQSVKEST